jgi:predicted transcriptional regulator
MIAGKYDSMFEGSEASMILDLLGNDTRRNILRLLVEEPKYFIQLSRELGVNQQAVLKHLGLLTGKGLVSSYRKPSDLGAPERKYFRVDRSLMLTVGLSSDMLGVDLLSMDRKMTHEEPPSPLGQVASKVEAMENIHRPEEIIAEAQVLMEEINALEAESERIMMSLLSLKHSVMKKVHWAIRRSFKAPIERKVLYSVVETPGPVDVEILSERLNLREKMIEEAIRSIEARVPIAIQ